MEHLEHQISKVKDNLESLSRTINRSLDEVNTHMDSVGHILAEYTHGPKDGVHWSDGRRALPMILRISYTLLP